MNGRATLFWHVLRGQRLRYAAAILALLVSTLLLFLVPLVPAAVIDALAPAPAAEPTGLLGRVTEGLGGRERVLENLWLAAGAIVLLTVLGGAFAYLRGRWAAMAAESIVRKLRDELYDHLQHLPCRTHERLGTGDLIQRCTSDVETLRTFLSAQVAEIGQGLVLLLVALPLMLAIDVPMALVSVALLGPILIFAVLFFRRVESRFLAVEEAESRMTTRLQENLTGIRVVRAFARQQHEEALWAERIADYRDRHYRLYTILAAYWSLSDLLCFAQLGLVLAVGGWRVAEGSLNLGELTVFLSYVTMFLWPVRQLGRILTELGKAMVALQRVRFVLDEPREEPAASGISPQRQHPATDKSDETPPPWRTLPHSRPGARSARGHAGAEAQLDGAAEASSIAAGQGAAVAFEHVSFAHGDVPVLVDVSLRIGPGQTLAILGPAGAGKSTLAHLLLRLYEPDTGRILLGGHELSSLPRQAARAQVASVLQEPFLFSRSVRENIRIGRPEATDAEVEAAARMACVHEAIASLGDGYETVVGERGVNLSGGQRQRIALARALLLRAPVLVLDDALSAVDTETEEAILLALRSEAYRPTTIVIAHRLSSVVGADRIVVLEHGRIVQSGTHAELLAEEGRYKRLWHIQTHLEDELLRDLRLA
jgi:ATP-binding cassette, subfamily B, bacterial